VRGTELVTESEDAVRAGFGGIKVVLGTFERGKVFNREVLGKAFDREAGRIVGHSIQFWGVSWRVLILVGGVTD